MITMLRALVILIRCDIMLAFGGFPAIYAYVRKQPVGPKKERDADSTCRIVAQACSWYPKRALCLQRSTVLTCLLRRQGINARLVIGAGAIPFRAHAWVEVDGRVVNDNESVLRRYIVMERC